MNKHIYSLLMILSSLLLFQNITFGQVKQDPKKIDFSCLKSGLDAGPEYGFQAAISPAGDSFTQTNATESSDNLNTTIGSTVTLYVAFGDVDKTCETISVDALGNGPYKIVFTATGGAATFVDSGTSTYEIEFAAGTNDQTLNSGQVELNISSFPPPPPLPDLPTIMVTAVIMDLAQNTCPSCSLSPQDPTYTHTWNITEAAACPGQLTLISPNYGVNAVVSSDNNPFEITLNGSPGSFENSYINEDVHTFELFFGIEHVSEDWLATLPFPPTTASQVFNMFITETSFAGGGFIMNSANLVIDKYEIPGGSNGLWLNSLPLANTAVASNASLGFCMQHDYSCSGSILHTHYARFRFYVFDVDGELGELQCPE